MKLSESSKSQNDNDKRARVHHKYLDLQDFNDSECVVKLVFESWKALLYNI